VGGLRCPFSTTSPRVACATDSKWAAIRNHIRGAYLNLGYLILRWLSARHLDPTIAVIVALIVVLPPAVLITRTIEQPTMRPMRGWYRRRRESSDLSA
jgi:hypothetical protein